MRLLHIGRATNNDIVIADQTVSRQHAQLIIDDLGQATFIDLNSANGSFVNGKRVSEPRVLDPTDIVKVGEYLLPWRNYLHGNLPPVVATQTPPLPQVVEPQAAAPSNVPAAAVSGAQGRIADEPAAPQKAMPWKWIGIAGGVLLLIIVLALLLKPSGQGNGNLQGKWHEKEDADTWIAFGENGKYTEGYKKAIVYDSATWKAMGIDRILIEKGTLEISRTYKFEGEELLITQSGKSTRYEREDE